MIEQSIITTFRNTTQGAEQLFWNILNQPEYSALKTEKKKVISGGLKRFMCMSKARDLNMQSDIPEMCHNYDLM